LYDLHSWARLRAGLRPDRRRRRARL